MKTFVPVALGAAMLLTTAAAEDVGTRPQVPIVIEATGLDACSGNGVVKGLDPHGDGFLAVKSAPALQSPRIDKLYNGEQVYICNQRGDWYGVVYTKDRRDCNVSSPWPKTLPYTGPCRSGWAHRNWIELIAG